jgi:glutathione-independent formaldehyde dehydrogenase
MKAVVVSGLARWPWRPSGMPASKRPTDAPMKVTSAAVCGTDLHVYEGRMGEVSGMVIGHEPPGVVEEVGGSVASLTRGDRVVVPTHICCGFCKTPAIGRAGVGVAADAAFPSPR